MKNTFEKISSMSLQDGFEDKDKVMIDSKILALNKAIEDGKTVTLRIQLL